MSAPKPTWTPAHPADATDILELMRRFYEEEHLSFEAGPIRVALEGLLAHQPEHGLVFLLPGEKAPQGYLVLTVGYSLEFHGRYITLDELYLQPSLRGQGIGASALDFAARVAGDQWGARTLGLEVTNHNPRARALYARHGFRDDDRGSMTRWL